MILFILNLTIFCNYSFSIDLDINSEAAILMDSKTGKILYEKNAYTKMYPASTTKILTAIIAIENLSLDEKITASYEAVMSIPSGYSNAAIQVGESLTVHELLQLFLIHSANEVGFIFAEAVSGSFSEFAELMNSKATEIGCENTNFTNPSGLHDKNHYTTAYDLALIAQYCMKNETFRSIVAMPSCTIAATDKYEERYFRNTNEMLNEKSQYYYKNVIGIKTGFTSQAKNCLIAAAKKDNTELISVVLGAPGYLNADKLSGKFTDTKTLLDFGLESYSYENIISAGEVATQVEVKNATSDTKTLDLIIEKNIDALVYTSTEFEGLKPKIELNENITAPILQNQVLGTITYTIDGSTYTSNLLAKNDVKSNELSKNVLRVCFIIVILIFIFEFNHLKKNKKRNNRRGKNNKSNGKYLYGRVKY